MSKSKRDLTNEEKRLWREVAKGVRTRRLLPPVDYEVASVRQSTAAKSVETGASAQKPSPSKAKPTPPPADRSGEKRVRRGRLDIGASIDLHGHTHDSAKAALGRFLRASHARDDRAVLVVTGAGRGGEGVIKRSFSGWLSERELRAIVSGYAPAHRAHGGAGAFYVFLKRRD